MSETLLLTLSEAAKELRVCGRTLHNLTQAGKVASVRLGRSVRYRREDLAVLVNANVSTVEPAAVNA